MDHSKGLPCYYGVLGVGSCSTDEEIRRAYRRLAMQWHPDKWTRSPALVGQANHKFQLIQEAYSVLSDRRKRRMYDAGMYDPDGEVEDDVEGFTDFLQEMASLMYDARKQEKNYSFEELQSMFWDMAQGFDIPELSSSLQQPASDANCSIGSFSFSESEKMARSSREGSVTDQEYNGHLSMPGVETYVTTQSFFQTSRTQERSSSDSFLKSWR